MKTNRVHNGNRAIAATVALSLAACAVSPAFGQTGYFSLQGNFPAAGDRHDFNLNLSRPVSNAETLRFQTFARHGGTNAAGDSIPSSPIGIDSVLTLLDNFNVIRGSDDDQFGGIRDSLLTWTGSDVNLNPSPLPSGNYRLNMIEFNNDQAGPWVVDLVGPADAMSFTGATPTGTSTISSLKFGTVGAGANVATFNTASNLTITGTLGVGQNGNGTLAQTGGTVTVGGITTINTGGTYNLNGGVFAANNNVVLNGGKLLHTSGTFSLAGTRTLNANTGAQVSFGGSYSINNGTSFTIQSGSSLSTSSFLDVGAVTNGTLTVTGAGSALNVGTGFVFSNADWGYGGGVANVTISNQATATLNTPALTIGSSTTPGSAGTVNVNTAATMSVKNLSIGNQSDGTGTLTVNGASSAVTQSGSSTLTVGATTGATGTGTLNVQNDAVFNTGTGAITINKTGTVNLTGGSFNANADVLVDGGKLFQTTGLLNLGSGRELTASNGAQVSLTEYVLKGTRTFTVQSGSSLTTFGIEVGSMTEGELLVTGEGSSLRAMFSSVKVGLNNASGIVTIANGATATIDGVLSLGVGGPFAFGSFGYLEVFSGARVDANVVELGVAAEGHGSARVDGIGSTLTASQLFIGSNQSATGQIDLLPGGVITCSQITQIDPTGTLAIAGGTYNANGAVIVNGGQLLHTSGTFNLNHFLDATNGALVSLTGGFAITDDDASRVESGSTLTLTNNLRIGVNNDGTLFVTGAGSKLITNTSLTDGCEIGQGGNGNLTIDDQATASFNGDYLGIGSSGDGSSGTLTVSGGAQVTAKEVRVGGSSGSDSRIDVIGADSKMTQTGASTLTLFGGGVNPPGRIKIHAGGTYLTGTGLTTIHNASDIENVGGTFTAGGPVQIGTGPFPDPARLTSSGSTTTGAITNEGEIEVTAGTTNTGAITGMGKTSVFGGTLTATGGIRQAMLWISGNGLVKVAESSPKLPAHPSGSDASVSRLDSLTIAAGITGFYGTLDLTNNDLIIDYDGASPAADIESMVRSGYNVVGDWQGKGIISSVAAVDGNYILAVADNIALAAPFGSAADGPLFGGVDVDLTTVLIKFTHRVDINLDGVITPDDAAIFGTNYDESVFSGFTWAMGDMNYDGDCTPDDASIFGTFYDESVASLPEPASLWAMCLLACTGTRRRCRKSA